MIWSDRCSSECISQNYQLYYYRQANPFGDVRSKDWRYFSWDLFLLLVSETHHQMFDWSQRCLINVFLHNSKFEYSMPYATDRRFILSICFMFCIEHVPTIGVSQALSGNGLVLKSSRLLFFPSVSGCWPTRVDLLTHPKSVKGSFTSGKINSKRKQST